MNTREKFKYLYGQCRKTRQQNEMIGSAYSVVNVTEDWMAFNTDLDVCEFIGDIDKAVLWAIHWRFFPPTRDDVPNGMSERHLGFVCRSTVEDSEVYYSRTLPDGQGVRFDV